MLPFAASETETFFVLLIAFSAILIGLILMLFLLISFIRKQASLLNQLKLSNSKSLKDLQERVDALSLMFSKTLDSLNDFKSEKKDQDNFMADLKTEITRIADGISGQDMMTKAIELARSGSNINAITSQTGLSKSDAEALIKFHKK